jgi:hypothetical protein
MPTLHNQSVLFHTLNLHKQIKRWDSSVTAGICTVSRTRCRKQDSSCRQHVETLWEIHPDFGAMIMEAPSLEYRPCILPSRFKLLGVLLCHLSPLSTLRVKKQIKFRKGIKRQRKAINYNIMGHGASIQATV